MWLKARPVMWGTMMDQDDKWMYDKGMRDKGMHDKWTYDKWMLDKNIGVR